MAQLAALLVSLLTLVLSISGVISTTFTIVNECKYTVWPGIVSGQGVPAMSTTGFELQKGESKTITAPASWSGRFWGRTHCSQDSTGKFSCVTGDCSSGKIECSGSGATPPVTLVEFGLDGADGSDFYDVSLVDGYNLPMRVVPQGGTGRNCTTVGCEADLNDSCPSELQVENAYGYCVSCKSPCTAFGESKYCCTGAYSSPNKCKPSTYSQIFKSACPQAYSYAYDDATSTFACASADYTISFCPTLSPRIGGDQGSPRSPPPSVSECKQGDGGKLYCDEECKRCRDRGGECKPGDNGKLYCDDTKKESSTKKLAIGLATLFAGIGIVTVLICCLIKRKFSSNQIIYFWKKKSLNHQTVQTFLRNCGHLAIRRYNHSFFF